MTIIPRQYIPIVLVPPLLCLVTSGCGLVMGTYMSTPAVKIAFLELSSQSPAEIVKNQDEMLGEPVQVQGIISRIDGTRYQIEDAIAFDWSADAAWVPSLGEEVIIKGYLKRSARRQPDLYLRHATKGYEHPRPRLQTGEQADDGDA